MTLGELIAHLHVVLAKCQDPDRRVVLVEDQEGNGARPLAEVRENIYHARSTWNGDIYAPVADQAPVGSDFVVALWPEN